MELKVVWTDFAKSEVKSIYKFLAIKNKARAKKITSEIVLESKVLKLQPYLGQIEENLNNRSQNFRYLIYKDYKLIYWINTSKKQVEIVDVFDCRQEDLKIKRNK